MAAVVATDPSSAPDLSRAPVAPVPDGRRLYLLVEPGPHPRRPERRRYRPDIGDRYVGDRYGRDRYARDRYARDRYARDGYLGDGYVGDRNARDRSAVRRRSPAVYRRRRVAALVAVAVLAVGVWMAAGRLGGRRLPTAPSTARTSAGRVWVVRPGDTLWAIALASGDRGDIRPLVDRLSAEVHGQPLQVGEQITLP